MWGLQWVFGCISSRLSRANTFDYESLQYDNSLRLIQLAPGKGDEQVRCTMLVTELDKAPRYDAISYVWGDATRVARIHINGKESEVTVSLRDALLQVRRETKPIYLWADSVCINQDNTKERGHQVRLMANIYKGARHVWVCLGVRDMGNGMQVQQLVRQLVVKINSQIGSWGGYENIPNVTEENFQSEYKHFDWQALHQMLSHPWFSRVWVVQEIGLAEEGTILYGKAQIGWVDFIRTLRFLTSAGLFIYYNERNLSRTNLAFTAKLWVSYALEERRAYAGRHRIDKFTEALDAVSFLESSDPRDHLYAMLGHPSAELQSIPSFVQPDYEKPVRDVFIEFAAKYLTVTGDVHILGYAGTSGRKADELKLPSWCPRWDKGMPTVPVATVSSAGNYKAGGPANSFRAKLVGSEELEIRGFVFDSISKFSKTFTTTNLAVNRQDGRRYAEPELLRFLDSVIQWEKSSPSAAYPNTMHAFALTCLMDTRIAHGKERYKRLSNYMTKALDCSAGSYEEIAMRVDWQPFVQEDVTVFERSVRVNLNSRNMFITTRGYFGLGGNEIREGDLCCIVYGSKVPVILRKVEDASYILIGDSYIQDLMQGEALTMMRDGEFKEESFIIK